MGNSAGKAGSPKAASVPAADDFAADQAKMLSTIREELRVLEASIALQTRKEEEHTAAIKKFSADGDRPSALAHARQYKAAQETKARLELQALGYTKQLNQVETMSNTKELVKIRNQYTDFVKKYAVAGADLEAARDGKDEADDILAEMNAGIDSLIGPAPNADDDAELLAQFEAQNLPMGKAVKLTDDEEAERLMAQILGAPAKSKPAAAKSNDALLASVGGAASSTAVASIPTVPTGAITFSGRHVAAGGAGSDGMMAELLA